MSAIAAWFVYSVFVSALLGLAAFAADSSARGTSRPARWFWFGAMALAVIVPIVAYLVPGGGDGGWVGSVPGVSVVTLPAVGTPGPVAGGTSAGAALLAGWAMVSALLLGALVRSGLRIRAQRSGWRRADLYGSRVWVTEDLGPAVFGWHTPAILLPQWVLTLDGRAQELLMLHEREHMRAGDPRLWLASALLVVLMPWNVVLWWMLARLRLAVEIDCDARVLARVPDARGYGGVLLEASRRRSGVPTLVAFAEPRRFLERRIRSLTAKPSAYPVARGLAFGLLGAASLVLAMCARDPVTGPSPLETVSADRLESVRVLVNPGELDEVEMMTPPPTPTSDDVSARPTFTPMTVQPRLANLAEAQAALLRGYPPVLRDAGIGGRANVWFYIDEDGQVTKTMLDRSSGYEQLDRAALAVASTMRFSPAWNRDRRVAVWVSIPIAFESR